jgi:hypothetical protein
METCLRPAGIMGRIVLHACATSELQKLRKPFVVSRTDPIRQHLLAIRRYYCVYRSEQIYLVASAVCCRCRCGWQQQQAYAASRIQPGKPSVQTSVELAACLLTAKQVPKQNRCRCWDSTSRRTHISQSCGCTALKVASRPSGPAEPSLGAGEHRPTP